MTIESLKAALPEYAKDLKLNLSTLAGEESLTQQQLWGCFVACAIAARNTLVTEAVLADAAGKLSPEAMNAAKAAAAIMAMNNIYYRFTHLSSNAEYRTLPAKLRMNVIGNPGVDKVDFELWSLAVSAVNGCGMCIDSHEQHLLKAGMDKAQIQTAVRVASVIHAVATVMDAESAIGQAGRALAA